MYPPPHVFNLKLNLDLNLNPRGGGRRIGGVSADEEMHACILLLIFFWLGGGGQRIGGVQADHQGECVH